MTALATLRPVEPRGRARRTAPAELYEGTAAHTRHGPDPRRFTPHLFLAHLGVGTLPGSLDQFPGWSARRRAHTVRAELRDYSPQQLAELGIREADIDWIAEEADPR